MTMIFPDQYAIAPEFSFATSFGNASDGLEN